MKRIIQINILLISMFAVFSSAHGQQKPSQRSFASVVNEIKQQQAMRNKMMQQIKQTTPSNDASRNTNTQPQQGANAGASAGTQQPSQNLQGTSQQPINNKQIHPQPSTKIKKE
jgi:hypothetical protein